MFYNVQSSAIGGDIVVQEPVFYKDGKFYVYDNDDFQEIHVSLHALSESPDLLDELIDNYNHMSYKEITKALKIIRLQMRRNLKLFRKFNNL